MNTRQAQYLITVQQEGSISEAAEKLYVSQPSLSQTIQGIEKNLNAKIFDRHTSPISLTYAGEKVMRAAREILTLNTNLQREIGEINEEVRGRMRIGISIHRAMHVLPKILPGFMEMYPYVEVVLLEKGSSKMDELLLSGKVDFAFLIVSQEKSERLEYIKLLQERMVLVTSPGTSLARNHTPGEPVDIREAEREHFISLRPGHGVRTIQDKLFSISKISPKVILETESIEVAKRMAVACDAVALYPESMLDESERKGKALVYYPIKGEEYLQNFYLCYDKSMFLPKYMRDFIELTGQSGQKGSPQR